MKRNIVVEGIISYLKKEKLLEVVPELISELKKIEVLPAREVIAETAIELSPAEKLDLRRLIEKKLGWKGDITYIISPKLLGGIKITAGDRVLDLSVKARLNDLYDQI
jgi:F-type H+-transporting ATPase subunit delta